MAEQINSVGEVPALNTEEFLSKILSDKGFIVLAEFRGGAMKRHHFCKTVKEATEKIIELNESGAEVYQGIATYLTPTSRKQENVAEVKSLIADVDIGKANTYQTRKEASEAIIELCEKIMFPPPMKISSGAGYHLYWPFEEAVSGTKWKSAANDLRKAFDIVGFKHDPARTSDQASILRPVGSTWRKRGERPVELVSDTDPKPFEFYTHKLEQFLGSQEVTLAPISKKYLDMFPVEKLGGKAEYPPSSAYQIANKCAQIACMRDLKGAISKPEWRNAIGLIKSTVEGGALIHEWSTGDPRYDYNETQRKIDKWETPPTTCAKFESTKPSLCASCQFKGNITSPIQLGYAEVEVQDELTNDIEVKPQLPRLASESGLINFSNDPPPPRRYILKDLILLAKVSILAGAGGVSKTMLAMIWAIHIALGMPWNGRSTLQGAVLLILGEEDEDEIKRRFNAIAKALDLNDEQKNILKKLIRAFPMNGLDSRLTSKKNGSLEGTEFTSEIIEASKSLEIESGQPVRLITLDHASLIHGGEFNSREDVSQTMRQVNYIAQKSKAAVLVLAHSSKASIGKDKADSSDVGGSMAWTDLARSVEVLKSMDENEGKALGIDEEERKNYVSLSVVKNNYGPNGDKFWLHRETVPNYGVSVLKPVDLVKPIAPVKGWGLIQARIAAKIRSVAGQYSKSGFRDTFSGKSDELRASKNEVEQAINEMLTKGSLILRSPTIEERTKFGLHHTTKQVLDVNS